MVSRRTCVAISEVVLYIPILPVAIYLVIRSWNCRPRFVWTPLVLFSLLRLASSTLTILQEFGPPDYHLVIATTVLVNIGVIPLLICTTSLVHIILKASEDENERACYFLNLVPLAFFVSGTSFVASGILNSLAAFVGAAEVLAEAGNIVLAAVVASLVIEMIHLHTQRERILAPWFMYVDLTLMSMLTLVMRTIYGLLDEFMIDSSSSQWSPVLGSEGAYALMCLFTEYISVLIYLHLGFRYLQDYAKERLREEARRNTYNGGDGDAEKKENVPAYAKYKVQDDTKEGEEGLAFPRRCYLVKE